MNKTAVIAIAPVIAAVFVLGQVSTIYHASASTVCINIASNSVSGHGHGHSSFSIHQSITQSNHCSDNGGTTGGGGNGCGQH